jgi:hypothetical protein
LSAPEYNSVRILHYVSYLVPCICIRYARRQFVAVYDQLMVAYRSRFRFILRQAQVREGIINQYSVFIRILLDGNYKDIRDELMKMCSENPLALHRLWKLNKDFGTPGALLSSIENHQKRVAWQLHRIYRARNNLVHAGRVPTYLDSLILNAFEYYTNSVVTLTRSASRQGFKAGVDQVVSNVGVEYRLMLSKVRSMQKASTLTKEQIAELFGE